MCARGRRRLAAAAAASGSRGPAFGRAASLLAVQARARSGTVLGVYLHVVQPVTYARCSAGFLANRSGLKFELRESDGRNRLHPREAGGAAAKGAGTHRHARCNGFDTLGETSHRRRRIRPG